MLLKTKNYSFNFVPLYELNFNFSVMVMEGRRSNLNFSNEQHLGINNEGNHALVHWENKRTEGKKFNFVWLKFGIYKLLSPNDKKPTFRPSG